MSWDDPYYISPEQEREIDLQADLDIADKRIAELETLLAEIRDRINTALGEAPYQPTALVKATPLPPEDPEMPF
jgi:outer membrane protein TolC